MTIHEPNSFPVVGIGASAGGLDAFRKLFDALPPDTGMAFILVQHLDPTHESLMVELLSDHTAMAVRQATDGMPVERNRVYVIPPGTSLALRDGRLRLSAPVARHGARLPFDFLLQSMAEELGPQAICIVLSGTGSDGSTGLRAIKESGGLVITQSPGEASYDGMPRNAIATGAVDHVLSIAEIPSALAAFNASAGHSATTPGNHLENPDKQEPQDPLTEIIEFLRTRTVYDFSQYKHGTLQRRIERRMGLASIDPEDVDRYLDVLRLRTHKRDSQTGGDLIQAP